MSKSLYCESCLDATIAFLDKYPSLYYGFPVWEKFCKISYLSLLHRFHFFFTDVQLLFLLAFREFENISVLSQYIKYWYCHIHKIALSTTPDLCSHVHQLQSTFAQVAVRTFRTSFYILLHYVPCTFDPSGLDSLLAFHRSCVRLQTQLQLYFSSVSAFIHI